MSNTIDRTTDIIKTEARRAAFDEAMGIIYEQIEAHIDDFANSVRARTVGHKMLSALAAARDGEQDREGR